MNYLTLLSAVLFLIMGPSCSSRPVEELTFADAAVRAAQKAKADAMAPDAFRQAENNFLRAKRDYGDGYYDSCRKYALQARALAEQAEYKALLKQAQVHGKADAGSQPADDAQAPMGAGDAPPAGPPPTGGGEGQAIPLPPGAQ